MLQNDMKKKAWRYQVDVECMNGDCSFVGEVKIPVGLKVEDYPCEWCGKLSLIEKYEKRHTKDKSKLFILETSH